MIYLKYGTYSSGSLTWSAAQSFRELKLRPVPNVEHIKGRDLQSIEYRHVVSTRNAWELIISADELYDTTKLAWLQTWFKSHAWSVSTDNSTFVEVVISSDGDMPIEDIEGSMYLPEAKFVLIQKNPD